MVRALVLGANGFIGGHVAAALDGEPDFDVVGAGLGRPLPGQDRGWREIDLLEAGGFDAAVAAVGPDVIVNCTGATSGTAADLIRLNVLTTAAVIDALARSRMRPRFIHIGSAAEYGPGPVGVPVAETASPRPVSPYGIAKLAATQLVTTAAAAGGLDAVVLRVFNALGPDMPPGTMPGGALRRLMNAVASSASRIEMGPLDSVRDFVDVRDIAGAVVAACRAPSLDAPIVNVGTGTGHTAREFVRALAGRVGFEGEIVETGSGSPRSAELAWQVADVELAYRLLGWRAAHDLASSVALMTEGSPPRTV